MDVGFDGDVGFYGSGSVKDFGIDFICDFEGTFEVVVGNDDFCAFLCEFTADGFAHSGSSSGYYSDFVHQSHVISSLCFAALIIS